MNEAKIDHRKRYILVLDTETANTNRVGNKLDTSSTLVYDVGYAVVDKYGKVYETASFVNSDIFLHERKLMRSAYYCMKIASYWYDLYDGRRKFANTYEIRKAMLEVVKKYNIKFVCAHNARFDLESLNNTYRWVTKSKYRYWFPYDSITWWDSMAMARSVIAKMPTYKKYCEAHNLITKTRQVRLTAEALFGYISKNDSFEESHTALEDVMIEKDILAFCYKQKKKMRKELFNKDREGA